MLLICYGTRPEIIKLKPLIDVLSKYNFPYRTLHIKQHEDIGERVQADFTTKIFNRNSTAVSDNRLDAVISSILSPHGEWVDILNDVNVYKSYESHNPFYPRQPLSHRDRQNQITHVLVQGDTATVFACALAAFHRKWKVIHLEAGLRSNDIGNPYPEEVYRKCVSVMTSMHLCPTETAYKNLILDNMDISNAHVVGNTVLDNLKNVNCTYGTDVVITMHRRENHALLPLWFTYFNLCTKKFPHLNFKFMSHPNPAIQENLDKLSKDIEVIDPLPHHKFVELIAKSRFVITDSGGLVEESSFLNKRSIVCRKRTERTEAIESGHSVLCRTPYEIIDLVGLVDRDHAINEKCPFGDGNAANKILELLRKEIP